MESQEGSAQHILVDPEGDLIFIFDSSLIKQTPKGKMEVVTTKSILDFSSLYLDAYPDGKVTSDRLLLLQSSLLKEREDGYFSEYA